jgi:hypothetical protein
MEVCSWHTVVTILGHYGIDHHPITGQALLDDPRCQRRRGDAAFLTELTDSFLALGRIRQSKYRVDDERITGLPRRQASVR